MLRPFTFITVQQVTPYSYQDNGRTVTVKRNEYITLDFVSEYHIEKGWEQHTNTAKLKFPKNVMLRQNKKISGSGDSMLLKQAGTYSVILGGTLQNNDTNGNKITLAPLLMKGDIISIQDGYWFKNENRKDIQVTRTRFNGFISKVHSKIPIEIDCEDSFYLLKRTPVNYTFWEKPLTELCKQLISDCNKLFSGNDLYKINGINPYPVLKFSTLTDEITANFSLGHLDIGSGLTASMLLNKIRSQYGFECFFTKDKSDSNALSDFDNVLQFGFPIYNEKTAISKYFFEFQNNIFDDCNLEYTNKEDIVLSTIVETNIINKVARTTKDGESSTKKGKISVLVYWDVPTDSFKYITKKAGEPFPSNDGGERHKCFYSVSPNAPQPTANTLFEFGKKQLSKYFYTGFKGSFRTFGFPFVSWNDNVNIIDKIFADRNGQYKVKKVIYYGGNGLEQEIFLDFKQPVEVPKNTKQIKMY